MRWPRPWRARKATVPAGELTEDVVIRRLAEGRVDVGFLRLFKAGHLVKAAAADDADFCFQ